MKKLKIHKRNLRIYVNGGMRIPECKVNDGPLDVDASRLITTGHRAEVTCKRCIKRMEKLPW